jgi:membrane-bound metal-dependent hydrolase YbcI (DUF457 family)
MPNYPTHARWGRIGAAATSVVVAAGIYFLSQAMILAFLAGLGAAAATFVGALYPDIDHHKSVPRRKAVHYFQGLTVLGVAALSGLGWLELVDFVKMMSDNLGVALPVPSEAATAMLVVVLCAVAAGLVEPVIGVVTREHRGWTHSPPINLVLILVFAGIVLFLTRSLTLERQIAALTVIGTFYLGTLIHLGLDGEIIG